MLIRCSEMHAFGSTTPTRRRKTYPPPNTAATQATPVTRRTCFFIESKLVPALLHDFRVRGQREQREVIAVEVIHQIKHAREPSAGEERLIPRSIFSLRAQKVGHATRYRIAANVVGRKQSQNRPRSLRRR